MYLHKINQTLISMLLGSIVLYQSSIPSYAASSAWEDLGGGKMRLLAVLDPITQKVTGGIEIKLKEGWSTYWRNPSGVGISPNIDLSDSNQLKEIQLFHPTPLHIKKPEGSYAGYKKSVTFLFEGELADLQNASIKSNIFIGLCSDICIPAQTSLEIKGSDLMQSDPLSMQHLTFSRLKLPKIMNAETIVDAIKLKDEKTLLVEFKQDKQAQNTTLFVEGPEEWYLTPGTLVSQDDTKAIFEVDVSRAPQGTDILSQELRYTLVIDGKSIETTR